MQVEIDCDDFKISYQRGTGSLAVIAFTGIGHALGGIQTEEFRRSLAAVSNSDSCSLIYVIDKKRLWYNNGLAERIAPAINNLLVRFAIARSVTLGNSMGGFGAICFARRLLHCTRAIAFCPQSSVNPRIAPFETRWPEWCGDIVDWTLPDAVSEIVESVDYDIMFGAGDPTDMKHASRFEAAGQANVQTTRIPACGHNVGAYLQERGELRPLLDRLIWST